MRVLIDQTTFVSFSIINTAAATSLGAPRKNKGPRASASVYLSSGLIPQI